MNKAIGDGMVLGLSMEYAENYLHPLGIGLMEREGEAVVRPGM